MANQRRQVSIFINGQAVESSLKGIREQMKKVSNELALMSIGSEEYEAKVKDFQKLDGVLRQHKENLSGVSKGLGGMKLGMDALVGLGAAAFATDQVIAFGRELFNTAVHMEAMDKKARVVFGSSLPAVTRAAEENARQMGLTSHEYVAAAANIQDLLVPLGLTRDEAAKVSITMTNMSGVLSEWTGGTRSAAEVSEILSAALLGEREALKGLGIDLQQADIDAALAAKGLANLTGEAEKQAEAMVTLELIMAKSTDAQTAFAEGQDSLARQSAELTSRWGELKESIASGLIPVFNRLLEMANDTFNVFTALGEGNFADSLESAFSAVNPLAYQLLKDKGFTTRGRGNAAGTPASDQPAASSDLLEDNDAAAAALIQKAEEEEKKKQAAKRKARQDAAAQKARDEAIEAAREQAAREEELRIYGERVRAAADSFARIQELAAGTSDAMALKSREDQQAEFDRLSEQYQTQLNLDLDYEGEKTEAAEAIRLASMSDNELQLEQLRIHYVELIRLAEMYGIDSLALKNKYFTEEQKLIATQRKTDAEREKEKQEEEAAKMKARMEAMAASYQALGEVASATFDLLGLEGEKYANFQKAATLAKIAFDTAAAISSLTAASNANPGNAFTFGTAGFIQFTTGLARIIANIAQAKKILFSAPKVQQKYLGGFLDVVGETDGRAYRAKAITAPRTGLLPNMPVMWNSNATGAPVLASERGAEYFVAAHDLRKPRVLDHVRMIDNITRTGGRVSQFAEGGINVPKPPMPAAAAPDPTLRQLAASIDTLTRILAGGITAVIPDRTVVDIGERRALLNDISGGYFPP